MVVLNETCIDFLTCSSSMKCGADEKDLENIEKAISYCHAVAFHVSIEYDLCAEKVDRRNSTCVQEWNPFPDFEEGIEDEKKKRLVIISSEKMVVWRRRSQRFAVWPRGKSSGGITWH
uniref:DUF19 domain-containing protein n=1 Tax=Caenorhabditis tropicalis TaxID=1561998 RepID=A0A1I7UJA8_9PELO